jgi:hypothetical protein
VPQHLKQAEVYHQAGHAVAGASLKLNLRAVTLGPGGETFERVHWTPPAGWLHGPKGAPPPARDLIERRAICCLAGPEAEWRLSRRPHAAHGPDRERVQELISGIADKEWERAGYVSWLEARAVMLVQLEWSSIRAVAAALSEEGRLSAARVRALYRESIA